MKDAYYFSHDANATNDPKIMILIAQWGLEAYGIFWVLIEHLREQPGFKSHLLILKALASRHNSSEEKFRHVVYDFGLFQIENDSFFFSNSLIERMKPLEDKRQYMRNLALKRWNKIDASALPAHIDTHSVGNASKVKKSKVKKSNIYMHKDFYKNELQNTNCDQESMKLYSKFIDILYGNNVLNRELTELLNIENQVSYNQFCKLLQKAKDKNKKFSNILPLMTNDKKYYQKKTSLYLCLNTWLNSDYK